jgi:hypothetical protein
MRSQLHPARRHRLLRQRGSSSHCDPPRESDVHPDDIGEEDNGYNAYAALADKFVEGVDATILQSPDVKQALAMQLKDQLFRKHYPHDAIDKRGRRQMHLENIRSFRRYSKTLAVGTGTAVAFSNTVPHRFNTITNRTTKPHHRIFINFFVVDPTASLPVTTANSASPAQIRLLLRCKGVTVPHVCKRVMDFCGGYSQGDLGHRTVVRDQARAAMSAGRQHWKTNYFGNAGYFQFFPDARWNSRIDTRIGVEGRNYEHSAKSSDLPLAR